MFGSDKRNIARGQGGQSETSVSVTRLTRGASPGDCDKYVARGQGGQVETNVSSIHLVRGVSPGGCGKHAAMTVPDPNHILSGGDDALEGGASHPTGEEYVLPNAYVSDVIWTDEDLTKVQDENDAIIQVDNL